MRLLHASNFVTNSQPVSFLCVSHCVSLGGSDPWSFISDDMPDMQPPAVPTSAPANSLPDDPGLSMPAIDPDEDAVSGPDAALACWLKCPVPLHCLHAPMSFSIACTDVLLHCLHALIGLDSGRGVGAADESSRIRDFWPRVATHLYLAATHMYIAATLLRLVTFV